ncbi:MAG: hypothetical protein M3Y33_20980 [Actinomycetota bacterium]|nr:hypothetical protein [Actinomycetota bacterium]
MTGRLLVEIGGVAVPLTDCEWVLKMACGCPCGVSKAEHGTWVNATEDQAWRSFFCESRREAGKAKRQGMSLELVTRARYSAEFYPLLLSGCKHAAGPGEVTGQMPLIEVLR